MSHEFSFRGDGTLLRVAPLRAKRELLRLRENRSMAANPILGASSHMPRHANHFGAGRVVENQLRIRLSKTSPTINPESTA